MLQHVGKQTNFWKHHTSPQHDEPTRWQLVSCTYNNIGKAHQEHVKSTEPNREPLNPWGWQTGAQFSRKLQVMVHCHAAVCTIYPVWQLPALYPVIDEACTLVFHLWPLPLYTMGISSPPWYDDSVSLASPHVSRIPGGTLHGQEDESWQHNAVVKDDGWASGLTECSAALKRWMFSRPDMACYHY